MSTTRITTAAKSGRLYDNTKVRWDGTQLVTELADGTDLSRTTLSAAEASALAAQLVPEPAPEPTPEPTPTPAPTPTPTGTEGKARLMKPLNGTEMDNIQLAAVNGDTAAKAYLERFERFRVYMKGSVNGGNPSDKAYAQGWLNPGWKYADVMVATYNNGSALIADEHYLWSAPPGAAGRKRLFVNWGCSNGSCPQWAADLGNPATRKRYVDSNVALAKTAGGLFVDDTNFYMPRVITDGTQFVRPWNPRTNALMTDAEWEGYMLQTLKDAKAALPDPYEVVINTVAYHPPGLLNSPLRMEALRVVDGWEIEGVTVGNDVSGYQKEIDYAHSVGCFIVHDIQSSPALSRVYTQAVYLLFNNGRDYYGHPDMRPSTTWDALWDKDIGPALGPAVKGSDGIFRRSFQRGQVVVNPATKTATIP